jgi:pantetheine-phosphate adenylyltransferase
MVDAATRKWMCRCGKQLSCQIWATVALSCFCIRVPSSDPSGHLLPLKITGEELVSSPALIAGEGGQRPDEGPHAPIKKEKQKMPRTGFYPGSFDPITYGHLDIIARAARVVDKLVIGIGVHEGKKSLLDVATRVSLIETVTKPIAEHSGLKVSVITFDDLAIAAAHRAHANVIIRGLRDASDFDYEVQMAQMNGSLAPELETIFFAASPATRMIASSLVKQIAKMGGDTSLFLPKEAESALRKAIGQA